MLNENSSFNGWVQMGTLQAIQKHQISLPVSHLFPKSASALLCGRSEHGLEN